MGIGAARCRRASLGEVQDKELSGVADFSTGIMPIIAPALTLGPGSVF